MPKRIEWRTYCVILFCFVEVKNAKKQANSHIKMDTQNTKSKVCSFSDAIMNFQTSTCCNPLNKLCTETCSFFYVWGWTYIDTLLFFQIHIHWTTKKAWDFSRVCCIFSEIDTQQLWISILLLFFLFSSVSFFTMKMFVLFFSSFSSLFIPFFLKKKKYVFLIACVSLLSTIHKFDVYSLLLCVFCVKWRVFSQWWLL